MKRTIFLLVNLLFGFLLVQGITAAEYDFNESWNRVAALADSARYEAANLVVVEILSKAQAADSAEQWARALIERTRLRSALGAPETAAHDLMSDPWPDDPLWRDVINLYFAHSLIEYYKWYSHDIRSREFVVDSESMDLKTWSSDRFSREINSAFLEVWSGREQWGNESVGIWSLFVESNSYPARIRGTLRDAVSYLWVEYLANSRFWQPGQRADDHELDLENLLAGNPPANTGSDLANPLLHPLRKISFIMADLRDWHQGLGHHEAALEAEMENIRRLHQARNDNRDRILIRQYLEGRLTSFDSAYPWWAMGQWLLARFLQQDPSPDSLVRAHREAERGILLHRNRPGGLLCADVVTEIEEGRYGLTAMSHDDAGKRSIQIQHKNLEKLYFRAWKFDMAERLADGEAAFLSSEEIDVLILDDEPDLSWTVDLPATEDYRMHHTYTGMPPCTPGAYIFAASRRRDFAPEDNTMRGMNLIVSDLVVTTQNLENGPEYLVRSGRTGKSLPNVDIVLYRQEGRRGSGTEEFTRTRTDSTGRAHLKDMEIKRVGLLARKGDDLAWIDRTQYFRHNQRPGVTRSFIYTDRPIYRPGQTVHWKVVGYESNPERTEFHTLGSREVTVKLIDANNQKVASEDLTTNDFGSAAGSFRIPDSGLLGNWRIEDTFRGSAMLKVEQYKRPTFEVRLLDPEDPLQMNRPATLTGQVNYFFGLPVTSGEASWRISRAPGMLGSCRGVLSFDSEVIATGESSLDANGQFQMEFKAEAPPRLADQEGVVYRFLVEADITDEGGETRSAVRSFNLGFVSVLASITSECGFMAADKPARFSVTLTDLNQVPRAGDGRWSLHRLIQPDRTLLKADTPRPPDWNEDPIVRTPGDVMFPRWERQNRRLLPLARWETGPQISDGRLQHGQDGKATLQLEGLPCGAFRIIYKTKDDEGRQRQVRHDFIAYGPEPGPLNLTLIMEPEYSTATAGTVLRILLHSGFPDQELYLQAFNGNKRILAEFRKAGQSPQLIEIPVTETARTGFMIRVSAIRDHQHLETTRFIRVPWDNKKLDVEFVTFRDRLIPGGGESFTVKVKSTDGTSLDHATAEVLAYMYDRSLDAIASHHQPSPLSVFSAHQQPGRMFASVGISHNSWHRGLRRLWTRQGQPLRPDRLLLHPYQKIIMRNGELYVRSGRSGNLSMHIDQEVADALKAEGVPLLQAFDVEGAEYMVEVKSAVSHHTVGSKTFEKYAIDSVDGSLSKQAGVVMRAGDLSAPGHEPTLRQRFSETAFFLPHVQIDDTGQAIIEFKAPDSVTDWNIWVHALTRDLASGSAHRQAATVKDLMVRPYLPRFLREGDTADLHVVINNAGKTALQGHLELIFQDPATGRDLGGEFGLPDTKVSFQIEPGSGTDLVFPLHAPEKVGSVVIKAIARTKNLSDGEQRLLPILPGRMHLMQSRFAALDGDSRRELNFSMMEADDDSTRIQDQLVVTVDAQLFGSVLSALPYLLEYPYECTEQTLNRYLCTSILSGVFAQHPQVRAMAEQMSGRQTPTETWITSDPNRRLLLEETPWLRTAGGNESDLPVINLLEPETAERQRKAALDRLTEIQEKGGGFPWFPGGPPSPHLTLYILQGLARGAEFGVKPPKRMVRSAWRYLHAHFKPDLRTKLTRDNLSWAQVTLLNYLMSSYPEDVWGDSGFTTDDQQRMLEFSFVHWRKHSLLLKGYLALTLARGGREDDARLVYGSVMDAAKHDADLGTYWAPEDRAWLWYNDSIESHAFTLRVLTELAPDDPRRKGLVQWLLLNKKLGHWKSTRATAEAIYALVHFMEKEGTLAVHEVIDVQVGTHRQRLAFDPDRYTGRNNQIVFSGDEIDPLGMSTVVVEKETPGLAFASATWHFSTEQMPAQSDGDLFGISRRYFLRRHDGQQWVLQPLATGDPVAVGDQIEVQLSITAKQAAEYVHLRDPRGAGFEPESMTSGYRWRAGLGFYEEVRDSGVNFFFTRLPTGQYTLKYRLRANMSGEFKVGPATLQSMYAPEFVAHSAGRTVNVSP